MKDLSVTLEGEEAIFSWKDGQVHTEGYDLESERSVLALTGYGEGIGVLLIAINDCCNTEREFISEANAFVSGHEEILADKYKEWPNGQILFEYLSYSSDPDIRWSGLENARLSERHYKRLLKDPELKFKVEMARLKQLPEKYFYALLSLSSLEIKYKLAQNENCPSDVLEILAKDEDEDVRRYVAGNRTCPRAILELLAWDPNLYIRYYIAGNSTISQEVLEHLAKDEYHAVRALARETLEEIRALEV